MRVFFVTAEDPIYVIEFFKVFFSEYPTQTLDVCGVTIDQPFHEPIGKTLRRVTRFYGYWGTLLQGLRFTAARLRRESIKSLALSAGIPVFLTPSVNDPAFLDRLRTEELDLIVSVAAPEIFAPELLAIPRLGCINLHSGKLPNYRGMMPTFWQILHGEDVITISVHKMVPKIDAGDVLGTHLFPLESRDSLDRVITGTKRESARLLIRVLHDLHKGDVKPIPLDFAEAGYFSFPEPADVREFRRRGHRLL